MKNNLFYIITLLCLGLISTTEGTKGKGTKGMFGSLGSSRSYIPAVPQLVKGAGSKALSYAVKAKDGAYSCAVTAGKLVGAIEIPYEPRIVEYRGQKLRLETREAENEYNRDCQNDRDSEEHFNRADRAYRYNPQPVRQPARQPATQNGGFGGGLMGQLLVDRAVGQAVDHCSDQNTVSGRFGQLAGSVVETELVRRQGDRDGGYYVRDALIFDMVNL